MGELVLSNSTIKTYKSCKRHYFLRHYRELGVPKRRHNPTTVAELGTRVHTVLEAFYGYDVPWEVSVPIIYAAAKKEHPDYTLQLEAERELVEVMVQGWFEWAAEQGIDHAFEVVSTEQTVQYQMDMGGGRTVTLMGKLDQQVRRKFDDALMFRDWKPQPLSEKVLTPTGWVTMGSLKVGDVVCGAHKEPVHVRAVYDKPEDDVYKVTFNDGTSVRATADHPWFARNPGQGTHRVLDTASLKKGAHIVKFDPWTDDYDADLPVDPYLLGAWLSNGSRNGAICDGVRETIEATGLNAREVHRAGSKVQYAATIPPVIREKLDGLGLLGKYSAERFIPPVYLHQASYRQRLALLHGLMDGDGCFNPKFRCTPYYSTVSGQLAHDVADLVRSLGAWAHVWTAKTPTYTGTVERRVVIRSSFNPFREIEHAPAWEKKMEEVAERAETKKRSRGAPSQEKVVRAIDPDGRELVRCIELDSDEHLYVTSGYTVTHNTCGNFSKADDLVRDEQFRFYSMLWNLIAPEGERVGGGLYTQLRRSTQSARSKGPYYQQIAVSYNRDDLKSMWYRTWEVSNEIDRMHRRLDDGENHLAVAYPNPSMSCSWSCPFVNVCHMADDGSRFEDALSNLFEVKDPYAYYGSEQIDLIKEATGITEEK